MLNDKKLFTKILNALSVDYIVEQGTSGSWTYRKWNSGIAECWGTFTEVKGFTSWNSNMYVCDMTSVSYPTNLFIAKPLCFANITSDNANAVASLDGGYGSGTKDQTPTAVAIRGTSVSGNANWEKEYHAIGKWK